MQDLDRESFESLEVVRGIAALYVACNHARAAFWAGGEYLQAQGRLSTFGAFDKVWVALNQLTRLGHEAVILFFVHSGFAIAYSLGRSRSVRGFYKRRIVRLYPTYIAGLLWAFLVLGLTFLILPSFFRSPFPAGVYTRLPRQLYTFSLGAAFKDAIYIPTVPFIGQFWSLPYEVLFYILAPLLILRPRVYIVVSLALTLIGLGLGSNGTGTGSINTSFFHQYFLVYNAYFAVGVAVYIYWDRVSALMDLVPQWSVLVALVGGFLVCVVLSVKLGESTRVTDWVAVLMSVLAIGKFAQVKISSQPLHALGRWSYSLYLTHVATIILLLFVFHGLFGRPPPITTPWLWPAAIPVCLLVAYACYWAVESRCRQYLQQLRKTEETKTV